MREDRLLKKPPSSFGNGRFIVEQELGRGAMGVVYQVMDREREMRVALKTLLYMHADNLYYFKREFRALTDIVHPNLCSLIELIKDDESWFLTMELVDGVDFLSHIRNTDSGSTTFDDYGNGRNKSLPERSRPVPFSERNLRKSIAGLIEGLNALHSAGKVHRDIKPPNVMVAKDDRVVLLDFGLITDKDLRNREKRYALTGTVAYMSPEQIEKGTVGIESDWYAVGAMLYESLTGQLPYVGPPLKMLVEKQVNDPVPPREMIPELPEDLAKLCTDLLSREPARRPGYEEILRIVKTGAAKSHTITTTNFTEHTQHEIFVGREREIGLLNGLFQMTDSESSFQAVVIEGVSGIGKSTLIERFKSKIRASHPSLIILEGRCYERESSPFKAFDGVIESLIPYLEDISDEELIALLPRNPELLVRLFPSLKRAKLFVDIPFSRVEMEDGQELRNRSFYALKELLSKLSTARPIVMIIDDMQWADEDSVSLLRQIGRDSTTPFAMLLVLLSRFANQAEDSVLNWNHLIQKDLTHIKLEGLSGKDAANLASLIIGGEDSFDIDAESISLEAEGHPMYISELVRHVAQGSEKWKNLSLDDVIVGRFNTLPKNVQETLEIVCVAGTPIKRDHLRSLVDLGSDEFYRCISLLRANKLIRSSGPRKNHFIEPYHDRVREAVAARAVSSGESRRIQLNIGRFLLSTCSDSELENNIFDIVPHLHAGSSLIEDERELLQLAELYSIAGRRSRETGAYRTSMFFYKNSIELFQPHHWDTQYDTIFGIYCAAAESARLVGDFNFTNRLVEEAKSRAKTVLEKARVYKIYICSLVEDHRPQEALDVAVAIISKLGVKLPRWPGKLYILARIILTKLRLLGKTEKGLLALPYNRNKYIIAAVELMGTIASTAYYNRPNLNAAVILKSIELSLKYGIDWNTGMAFVGWSFINSALLKNYEKAYGYGKIALNIQRKLEDNRNKALTLYIFVAFTYHWKKHIKKAKKYYMECHKAAYRTGDLFYWAMSSTTYCCLLFYSGRYLPEVEKEFVCSIKTIEYVNQDAANNRNNFYLILVRNFLGLADDWKAPEENCQKKNVSVVAELIDKEQNISLFDYCLCKLVLFVYFGFYKEASDAVLELVKFSKSAVALYMLALVPFYDSLACLKQYSDRDAKTQKKLLRRVRKNQRLYRKAAENSPANHAHKYDLVEAEWARIKGKSVKAMQLYNRAIKGAMENEFIQDAALASEFAADCYREIGQLDKALSYGRDSLSYYEKWGAAAKQNHVKKKFGL